jgi:putative FmdB family regulatory protein
MRMPVYEYDCEECGRRFDLLVQRKDEEVRCSDCGGERVKKRFSVFSTGRAEGRPAAPA